MNIKRLSVVLFTISSMCIAVACHTRKEAGTKEEISKSTAIPPGGTGRPDTSTHTPTPNITPRSVNNVRPKPVPNPQPPVPPM